MKMMALAGLLAAAAAASGGGGLTLTHFNNTACAGDGSSAALSSLEGFPDCSQPSCGGPSSLLLTGRVAPPAAGNYGFQLTFDPPLPYPSDEAFAYLWVHDHLLYPLNTNLNVTGHSRQGSGVPLWIPLPPRALNADLSTIEHGSAAPLASYEVRLQYVCRRAAGCGRKISLRWATFDPDAGAAPSPPPFTPIPASALLRDQSAPEAQRRALYAKLQSGWGTYYHPGMLTWVLMPESFAVKVGLFRLSTGDFLSPEGLTINPALFHNFVVRAVIRTNISGIWTALLRRSQKHVCTDRGSTAMTAPTSRPRSRGGAPGGMSTSRSPRRSTRRTARR